MPKYSQHRKRRIAEMAAQMRTFLDGQLGKRLGTGEYYSGEMSGPTVQQHFAREHLKLAILDQAPEVFFDLEDHVFPRYWELDAKLRSESGDANFRWNNYRRGYFSILVPQSGTQSLFPPAYLEWLKSEPIVLRLRDGRLEPWKYLDKHQHDLQEHCAFHQALMDWAIQYRIEEDWILDDVMFALHRKAIDNRRDDKEKLDLPFGYWFLNRALCQGMPYGSEVAEFVVEREGFSSKVHKIDQPKIRLSHGGEIQADPIPRGDDAIPIYEWEDPERPGRRFVFRHFGWDPLWESWSEIRKDIEAKFKIALDQFEQEFRNELEGKGYVRPKLKFTAEHFDMFALKMVKGETFSSLAARFKKEQKTIENAIAELAVILGMKLPKSSPGRPKKKTSK